MATTNDRKKGVFKSLDWPIIIIYIALLGLGWMSVCGASYDFDQGRNFFDFNTRSGMQIVWIGTSFLLASLVLSVDERIFDAFAYVLYIGFLLLLLATPFLAHDIKGSLSWIKVGSFSIQPAEFAKFATALCVAKYMGSNDFNIQKWWQFATACALILVPMALIILQKETGSALVYLAFFLMFYREGMPGSILFAGVSAVILFVVGVRFAEEPLWGMHIISLGKFLVMLLILILTVAMMWVYTDRRSPVVRILLNGTILTLAALLFSKYVIPFDITWMQLVLCVGIVVYLVYLAFHHQMLRYAYIALFAAGAPTRPPA